ncbi:hypothetical protein AG1IA_06711 [Rhizoctonia solani AG-1 IA]|uniref:Uncharacterized protein n=1 Tax=Thanatephorus cucumeris (strain AG1-IA) TaxID=983506 RepID=L8WM77_THACA|nr:hypothetical protein AG1IA_06711 [Rhizoctonia solani AG-1 IA]
MLTILRSDSSPLLDPPLYPAVGCGCRSAHKLCLHFLTSCEFLKKQVVVQNEVHPIRSSPNHSIPACAKENTWQDCQIYSCFSHDVLSGIFLAVLYDPTDKVGSSAAVAFMARPVEMIYRRLCSLLAVYTSWRNIGLTHGALWSVIPLVDPEFGDGLCFAASLGKHSDSRFRADFPASDLSRYEVINIHETSDAIFPLTEVLELLIRHGAIGSISNSFIGRRIGSLFGSVNKQSELLRRSPPYFDHEFSYTMQSLSVLWTEAASLEWKSPVFSSRLVVLHISNLSLGDQSDMEASILELTTAN